MQSVSIASPRLAWSGMLLGGAGAIAFSGKAIIVKLAYPYGVDAVTVIMYRMLFALRRGVGVRQPARAVEVRRA